MLLYSVLLPDNTSHCRRQSTNGIVDGYGQESGQGNAIWIRLDDHRHGELLSTRRYFLGHAIEGVHIGAAAQQSLPQDNDEHNPYAGRVEPNDFS